MTLDEFLAKEEIRELRIRYSHCFDGKDIDGLVGLFTDDAVCEFGPHYGGNWEGRDAIARNFAAYLDDGAPPFSVLHSVTNPLIELIDDHTANGRWYLHDLITAEGADSPVLLYGIYDDVYRKVGSGAAARWLIARTRIDFLWPRREYYGPRSPEALRGG